MDIIEKLTAAGEDKACDALTAAGSALAKIDFPALRRWIERQHAAASEIEEESPAGAQAMRDMVDAYAGIVDGYESVMKTTQAFAFKAMGAIGRMGEALEAAETAEATANEGNKP